MMQDDLPPFLRDLLYAERHRLLNDPVGDAVKRAISAGVDDDFVRGLLTEPVRRHRIARAFGGPFDPPHLHNGEIVLGLDSNGDPIRVPAQSFNDHCLTLSGSGGGKTIKSRFLALQIAPHVDGLWLIDLRKMEFRCLVSPLRRLGVDLIVLPARWLRWNPLQCPRHVEPLDYAPRVADLLVQVLRLPVRASKLVHQVLFELYERSGVLKGSEHFPTLFELRERIATSREANAPARQAVVDALDPVLISLRSVLCYRQGWSTHDLAQRHLVLELAGLGEVEKDLLIASLLLSEFTSRIAQGVSNAPMNLWISLDEAARLMSARRSAGGLNDLIGLVRGVRIGVDLSGQGADVSPAVLSNAANKCIGRVTSATDLELIGASMGLTSEQKRHILHTLTPGQFVGQIGTGDWRYPFLFRVPRLPGSGTGLGDEPTCVPSTLAQLPCLPMKGGGGA